MALFSDIMKVYNFLNEYMLCIQAAAAAAAEGIEPGPPDM
jgi:hypothetical protein